MQGWRGATVRWNYSKNRLLPPQWCRSRAKSYLYINEHAKSQTRPLRGTMGVQKKTRKFVRVKRIIGQRDSRLKKNQLKGEIESKKKAKADNVVREMSVLL